MPITTTFPSSKPCAAMRPNCCDFGEEAMKQWWKEKDFIGYLPEKTPTQRLALEDAMELVLEDIGVPRE